MIILENVTKYYELKGGHKHYVVDNISLEIPSNKSLAILGPNGAGKSTLLRLIGGAEAPNSGRIISDANISWPLGLNAGFQGSLSGKQNIEFVCEINGLNKKETAKILKVVEEFAEIGRFFEMPVKSYSSGMRARLGFGLSICFDFDYYLIDELTSVGDAIFRQKATKEFEKIKERASLIFVAHNLDTLRASCDTALFISNGKATYFDDIEDGIRAYNLYVADRTPTKKAAKKAAKKVAKKAAKKVPSSNKIETTSNNES
jgi:capsular polysaccharide transport system ATP-binding protein